MSEHKPPIAVIMAAGKSTRMKSATPKVLHPLAGRAVIDFVIQSAVDGCGVTDTVAIIGYERERVRAYLSGRWNEGVRFAVQDPQHGTGHAVMQAEALLADWDGDVLTLAGDTPLLTPDVLAALLDRHRETGAAATILTAQMDDPASYGRIVRGADGAVTRIVETKDASPEERGITEINTSIYCFQAKPLFQMLKQVKPVNAQGEYYLTDVIALLAAEGAWIETVTAPDAAATMGINTRAELAKAAAIVRRRILNRLMLDGVSIVDPANTYIDADVTIGQDTTVWPGSLLEGATTIGVNCTIGPHAHIVDSQLGDGVTFAQSRANLAEIGDGTSVGPFAHLRPGTVLGKDVRIGSFVETKKAEMGDGAHVAHLSYIGDATVGDRANIGGGTITCNYDGVHKHKTAIGADAFLGSNNTLVAPVTVGEGAYTAAGSAITEDVPPNALALGRARQVVKEGWAARKREERNNQG